MENFKKGDFIRLKNISKWNTGRILHTDVNIFEIEDINGPIVKIKNCVEQIPFAEIEPIPIDGVSDFNIYYDPIVAASIVPLGHEVPRRSRDTTYYYTKFSKSVYESKNFQQLVEENGFKFVHEIQHWLWDEFKDRGLKINAY